MILERNRGKTGKTTRLYTKRTAVLNNLTHLAEYAPSLDGMAAAIYESGTTICRFYAWCNPLASEKVMEKAVNILLDECGRCATIQVSQVQNMLPFDFCDCCGKLTLLFPENASADPGPPGGEGGHKRPASTGRRKKA